MARLPDVDSLGARPVPSARRSIATVRNAGAVGDAVVGLGDTAARIGEQRLEREDKLSYAAAKTAVLSADIAARQELQDDPDYATYEQRYNERMGKARAEAAKLIGSKFDRRTFEVDTQLDVERGLGQVRDLARGKRAATEFATGVDTLDQLRGVARNAPDEATRLATLSTANETIQGMLAKGIIDPGKAIEMRREFAGGHVKARVSTKLDDGDVDGAKAELERGGAFLDDETYIALHRAIDGEAEDRRTLNDVDAIWAGEPANAKAPTPADVPALVTTLFPGAVITDTKRSPNSRLGRANPRSYHIAGQAIDVRKIPGVTFEQFVGGLRANGVNVVEAIDEYKNPSKHATGGHWHVAWKNEGQKRSAPPQTVEDAVAEFRRRRPDASPKEISAARSEFATRFSVAKDAEQERDNNAIEAVQAQLVKNGGNWFGLPASVRSSVPAKYHDNMIAFSNSLKVDSDSRKTDPVAYVRLTELQARDPKAFAKINPIAYFDKLDRPDWERLVAMRNGIIEDGVKNPGYVTDKAIMEATGNRLSAAGILTGDSKEAQKQAPRVAAYQRHMRSWAEAFELQNGRPPNEQEISKRADLALIEARFEDQPYDTSFAFEAPFGAFGRGEAKAVVPKDIAERIRDAAGRSLTDKEVVAVYLQFKGRKW